jgi:protease-4
MEPFDPTTPPPTPPAPTPPPTIVIQQPRDRGGWLRRLVVLGFWLLIGATILGSFLGRDQGLPTRLPERYVAGEITGAKVAIVDLGGAIFDDQVDFVRKQLRQARSDVQVQAVVIRIDSPGGTVSGSDELWREVEMLRASGKPVVASLGGIAASGGYYVAAACDHIIAEPTTLTGSIGVISELPNVAGLMDKLGVEVETVATGPWKDTGSYFRPLTDPERDRWRQLIGASYDRFVRIVARGRGLSIDQVRALADGKIYTTDEAIELKLVNESGYLDDAILAAQRRAKLEGARVVRYSRPFSLVDSLTSLRSPAPGLLSLDPEGLLRSLATPRLLYLAR